MPAVSPQFVGSIQRAIDQLRRDESGSIVVLFALTAVVMMAMIGGAIDFGRAVHARYQIQQAIDASVLAAARVWQTEQDITLAEQKALIHYASNKPTSFASEVSQFTFDPINNTISMQARRDYPGQRNTAGILVGCIAKLSTERFHAVYSN